jgi:hypothetical protein
MKTKILIALALVEAALILILSHQLMIAKDLAIRWQTLYLEQIVKGSPK